MAQVTIIPAKNHNDEIVRTAAYARVSSDSEDQLNSFNAQIRYYTEMLQNSDNAVFVDMYADEGISGTGTAKREEFQRLMSDCRKGKIDRILTKSVSRFARNTKDCLEAIRELKNLGVSVYFEKENIDTGEISSEMLLTLYSQFAQEESMSISRNCRMGVHKRMADGTYKNASVAYGYQYVDGIVKINEKQASIVRRVFKEYLDGKGTNEIANMLNKSNSAKPPNAKEWYPQLISNIITNERYIGDSLLQKKYMTDTLPFQKKINRGEKVQYYITNTHKPIISKEIFEAVQELRRAKSKIYHREPGDKKYTFSRMIVCNCCGRFRRKTSNQKVYWVCINHDRKGSSVCGVKQIRETEFQAAFIRLWNKLQAHYKAVLAPMLRQLETLVEREKSGNAQLAELRKEISEIKRQIHLLTMLNSQGTLDGAYFKERSAELDRKLLNTQKQLRASLDDSDSERLDELRKLVAILEKSEQITEFDEIKFGQIVERITVLSDTQIRFELIGKIGFTERIAR